MKIILSFTIQFALYMSVGWAAKRFHIVDDSFEKQLGNFLVNFALPFMIIRSLYTGFAWDHLRQYAAAILLALMVLALSGAVGQACYFLMGRTYTGRAFRFGLLISNFTFMGMPLAENLLGTEGLSYFALFTVPIRIFYYCAVERLLSPRTRRESRLHALRQSITSPPVLGVFAGLLIAMTGIALPNAVEAVVSGLGSICSPMGMILCGMTLGGSSIRAIRQPRFLLMPLLRLVALPACIAVIFWLLPIDILFKQIAVLYTALPCAGMMVVYTVRYEPDRAAWQDASVYVAVTNLLSVLSVPFWSWLILLMAHD